MDSEGERLGEPAPRRDRGVAITILIASLAIAAASLPSLSRIDRHEGDRVDASGSDLAVGTDPPQHGRPARGASSPGPAAIPPVTVVLPSGLVITLSSETPAFFGGVYSTPEVGQTRPPLFGGATGATRPPTTSAPGQPTTTAKATTTVKPTTTAKPTTTTTRFVRTPPTTVPGQGCTTQVPAHYVDEAHAQLIFDGQSLSLAPDYAHSWPSKVTQRRFPDRRRAGAWRVVAKGGTTYEDRAVDASSRVDGFVRTPTAPGVTDSILFDDGGESDLIEGASAQEIFERAAAYHRARHQAGFLLVIGFTIPPAGAYTPAQDQQRQIYNDGLRKYCWSAGIDVLIDVAAIPQLQDPHNPQWFDQSDGYSVHYTDAATDLVADKVIQAFR